MGQTDFELSPPILLVAMPQVLDPFFHKSVVLLLHHEDEGSFGFIINRATGIKVNEILQGMEVGWQGGRDLVAYFGGPVQPQLGTVLFSPEEVEGDAATEVIPGLALTQHIGDLAQLAESPPGQFRLLLGYAGWGAGQLMEEILRNDWLTAPPQAGLIFAPDPEQVWGEALRSVGVDPSLLPSWTTPVPGDGEAAN
ncbi:MAG TPA: YqgE/AlgH family protein [Thermoanaerobaculia bacterium]|nr:YqgE/AlgH family protein [Thermoanaerobaculia bacterium]